MVLSPELKGKIADFGADAGLPAPEGFLDAPDGALPPLDGELDITVMPMEEHIAQMKSAPDFDLVSVLKMLLADDASIAAPIDNAILPPEVLGV